MTITKLFSSQFKVDWDIFFSGIPPWAFSSSTAPINQSLLWVWNSQRNDPAKGLRWMIVYMRTTPSKYKCFYPSKSVRQKKTRQYWTLSLKVYLSLLMTYLGTENGIRLYFTTFNGNICCCHYWCEPEKLEIYEGSNAPIDSWLVWCDVSRSKETEKQTNRNQKNTTTWCLLWRQKKSGAYFQNPRAELRLDLTWKRFTSQPICRCLLESCEII